MKNRNALYKLDSGWFKSRTKIFHMGLSVYEIAVYSYLSSCIEEFNPSVRVIAKYLRISKNTASDAIGGLIERNMIRQIAEGTRGVSAKYEFVRPDLWK